MPHSELKSSLWANNTDQTIVSTPRPCQHTPPVNLRLNKLGHRSSSLHGHMCQPFWLSPDFWSHSYSYDQHRAPRFCPDLQDSLWPRNFRQSNACLRNSHIYRSWNKTNQIINWENVFTLFGKWHLLTSFNRSNKTKK